jgi:hypothetical protein
MTSGGPTPSPDHAPALNPVERAFVHQMWTRAATHEAESIATFLQLRAELEVLDAPPELVERALAAAGQEVDHARFATAVARRTRVGSGLSPAEPLSPDQFGSDQFGSDPVGTDPVGTDPFASVPSAMFAFREPERASRTTTGRRYRLLRLAVEAYVDGCLGEAAAADRLRRAAPTSGADLSASIASVARDEQSHVALAWSTIEWVIAECGPLVVWTLRRLPSREPKPGSVPPAAADPDRLRQWGWIDPDATLDTFECARRAARRRLLELAA